MTPRQLYEEAKRRGLSLEHRGQILRVYPARLCSTDFASLLQQNKPQIMALLEAKSAHLPADCAPWIHIARQVLAGEFDGADRSTIGSLMIGLNSIVKHPIGRQAFDRLSTRSQKRSK